MDDGAELKGLTPEVVLPTEEIEWVGLPPGSVPCVQLGHPQCGGHYGEAGPRQEQKLQLSKTKTRLERKFFDFSNRKIIFLAHF